MRFVYTALIFLFFSCRNNDSEVSAPLFTLMNNSGIDFQNTVIDTKEDNSFLFRNYYNGGGVAIADINNDSLCDVLLTSNTGENKLFLNKGNWQFEDITAKSGMRQDSMWSTGAAMVDINNDGWLDIYVCNSGKLNNGNRRNKLYINNHNLRFTESAAQYGLDHSGFCTQASFFDYDMDGDLDCMLINNSPLPFSSLNYAEMRDTDISQWNVDDNLKGGGNHLFRNDNGKYIEVTKEAGLHSGLISFGLGVSIADLNNDNYPDIYVGNDFIERDYLYINQTDGTFKDELEERIQQISMSSMSTDVADVNNDGYPEILTTDMIPEDDYRLKTTGTFDNIDLYLSKQKAGLYHQYVKNCFQLNNGNGTFSEISNYCGIAATDWSWGALFIDADNDGLNDVFICNGINKDLGDLDFLDFFSNEVYMKMLETGKRQEIDEILKQIPVTPLPNRIFKNNGNLQFTDIGKSWGLDKPGFSNSIAYGDLDNDGDLDIIINNENQPASVYRNNARQQNDNNYIALVLKGTEKNTHAVGTKIKLYKDTQVYYREVAPSRGFQSSVDYKQIIGLGKLNEIDSMVVTWPDRSQTRYLKPVLNKLHVVQQPSNNQTIEQSTQTLTTVLQPTTIDFDKHTEDEYVDFYYERNLPEMLSKEGPRIAIGDVNGDGLEDFYIGGAKGQGGQLYLQTADGFRKSEQAVFKSYSDFEDVAALFFDADKDGDLDLFLGAGGNNVRRNSRELQHRLYKNDGKGNFEIDIKAFPNNSMNISVAVSFDYDEDGDLDLFVGSRSIPYAYGITPDSYIYQNDGSGHFKETQVLKIGMITGAAWLDKNLVIVGEWMSPKILHYNKGVFDELKQTGLENLSGWWQTIKAADLNADGKTDLVLGNIGENFYLRPNDKDPVKLWINDFNQDGNIEQFITRTINGKDMPVFLKRDVTDQFPALKKQNLKHRDYAVKTVQDLFGNELMRKSIQKEFNYCSSIIAINDGKGSFTIKALPYMAQLSSVNAIQVMDIDKDNHPDLVLGGNLSTFPPQFGRLDASYGQVLLNKGNAEFSLLGANRSGLSLSGEIKDIKNIKGRNSNYLLFAQNNKKPALYKISNQ